VVSAPRLCVGHGKDAHAASRASWRGSAAGLSTTEDWQAWGQEQGWLGFSAACAGDLNGDGFSEVVIGEPAYPVVQTGEGRAHVYMGSATGLPTPGSPPDWTAAGGMTDAKYGWNVTGAGDVTGDGFGDVAIGAPEVDDGHNDEGRAYYYDGNLGAGRTRLPRQRQPSNTAAIALLGRSESNGLRLLAHGRTPLGRGEVQLQWEIKRLGVAFDGSGLELGGVYDTGQPIAGLGSRALIDELVAGLEASTIYHWRMRIETDSPFFPRSAWLALAGNNWSEIDLRTGGASGVVADPVPAASPAALMLDAARPNPFNPSTSIAFTIAERGRAALTIYDVRGRFVTRLIDGVAEPGRHVVVWDGRSAAGRAMASGVYLIELSSGGERRTGRMTLVQ
jgi:hypothetical protein